MCFKEVALWVLCYGKCHTSTSRNNNIQPTPTNQRVFLITFINIILSMPSCKHCCVFISPSLFLLPMCIMHCILRSEFISISLSLQDNYVRDEHACV